MHATPTMVSAQATSPSQRFGDAPQFPQVVMLPAPPAAAVPVAYPGISMRLQLKQPNGQWSPTLKLPWRPGRIVLPVP